MAFNPSLWMILKIHVFILAPLVGMVNIQKVVVFDWKSGLFIVASTMLYLIGYLFLIGLVLAVCIFFERLLGSRNGVICEHELEILDEGLSERTAYNDCLHEWKSVKAVYENSRFYFIRVFGPPSSFHIVPKNGCDSGNYLYEFITKIKVRIQAEHGVGGNGG